VEEIRLDGYAALYPSYDRWNLVIYRRDVPVGRVKEQRDIPVSLDGYAALYPSYDRWNIVIYRRDVPVGWVKEQRDVPVSINRPSD
jgi:hypothetical protein